MHITISTLTLHNFKGVKHLDIHCDRADAVISGANATGKTTVMDAWLWLLFGKDSTDRSAFSVKPQDTDGNEMHNLETVVEAVLYIDGAEHVIRKTMTEKWVTKRGYDVREFTGNETAYMIDGAPKKAGEWSAWVGGFITEKVFRLLSNPLHFNSVLPWKERRETLFDLIPAVSEHEIAAADPAKYTRIAELLEKHDVDSARKAIAFQTGELEKERKGITPRIDELKRGIDSVDEEAITAAREEYAEREKALASLDGQLSGADDHAAKIAATYEKIAGFERQKAEKQRKAEEEANRERAEGLRALSAARRALIDAEHHATTYKDALASTERDKERAADDVVNLRAEWNRIHDEAPPQFDVVTECPTCRQSLPAGDVEIERAKLTANWEAEKQRRLSEISGHGRHLNEIIAAMDTDLPRMRDELTKAELHHADAAAEVERLSVWEKSEPVAVTVDTGAEDAQIGYLRHAVSGGDKRAADAAKLREERGRILLEMQKSQEIIAAEAQIERGKERIAELMEREKAIGAQLAELEGQRFAIEQLVMEKCALLENQINSMFLTVKWKLFDRQINGGITDCCECMIDGVPYPDANNASKINAGMEIIDRLCRTMDVRVPIFIDNAESVNALRQTDSQTVTLVVTYDPALRVETREAAKVA